MARAPRPQGRASLAPKPEPRSHSRRHLRQAGRPIHPASTAPSNTLRGAPEIAHERQQRAPQPLLRLDHRGRLGEFAKCSPQSRTGAESRRREACSPPTGVKLMPAAVVWPLRTVPSGSTTKKSAAAPEADSSSAPVASWDPHLAWTQNYDASRAIEQRGPIGAFGFECAARLRRLMRTRAPSRGCIGFTA